MLRLVVLAKNAWYASQKRAGYRFNVGADSPFFHIVVAGFHADFRFKHLIGVFPSALSGATKAKPLEFYGIETQILTP
jgi:hypothetical protein